MFLSTIVQSIWKTCNDVIFKGVTISVKDMEEKSIFFVLKMFILQIWDELQHLHILDSEPYSLYLHLQKIQLVSAFFGFLLLEFDLSMVDLAFLRSNIRVARQLFSSCGTFLDGTLRSSVGLVVLFLFIVIVVYFFYHLLSSGTSCDLWTFSPIHSFSPLLIYFICHLKKLS